MAQLLRTTEDGLRIVGYADEIGAQRLNYNVSRLRAEKVAAMLVAKGVAREKLVIAARSTLVPISAKGVGEVALINRRVVFERLYDRELDAR